MAVRGRTGFDLRVTVPLVMAGFFYHDDWYHPTDILAAYAFHQRINLEIMRAFEKEGIDFAFPTTTNYLTQEDEKPLQIKITGTKEFVSVGRYNKMF